MIDSFIDFTINDCIDDDLRQLPSPLIVDSPKRIVATSVVGSFGSALSPVDMHQPGLIFIASRTGASGRLEGLRTEQSRPHQVEIRSCGTFKMRCRDTREWWDVLSDVVGDTIHYADGTRRRFTAQDLICRRGVDCEEATVTRTVLRARIDVSRVCRQTSQQRVCGYGLTDAVLLRHRYYSRAAETHQETQAIVNGDGSIYIRAREMGHEDYTLTRVMRYLERIGAIRLRTGPRPDATTADWATGADFETMTDAVFGVERGDELTYDPMIE